jgi:tetratricopeptide (TPR) repeat protein
MHRCLRGVLAALLILSTPALAQKEPRRPKLPADADTNSAQAYYAFALANLRQDAEKAADALYWSTMLEPANADAYYARRIALLLSDQNRLLRYWSGDRRTLQSADMKRIDSLYYHALTINPFVSQTLDREIFEMVANIITRKYEARGYAGGDVRYAIDREIASAPASTKAWLAYGEGRFADALELYAFAIKSDKNETLRLDRARVFFQMGKIDSATVELLRGLEELRKRDKKDLVYVYQSKALTEHSIGIAHLRLGHPEAAREAFGRALEEDLAYAPAHFELAYLLFEMKDTTAALNEMDLAVQAKGDDPATRNIYGYTLTVSNKFAEAETQLRKAIELDRYYAAPHFTLAFVLEALGRKSDAIREYRTYIAMAPRTDDRVAEAEIRLSALGTGAYR